MHHDIELGPFAPSDGVRDSPDNQRTGLMVASATVLAVVIVAAVSYVLQSRGQQLLEQLCASPQVLLALEHVPAALNPCQVRAQHSREI